MRKPRAILFDLWGTLIRSEEFHPARGNAAVLTSAENLNGATEEQIEELANRIISSVEPWEEKSRLEFTEQSLLRIIKDSFGLRFNRSLQELEVVFWKAALKISLIEGINETLDFLRARGIRAGIVSNSSFTAATIEGELKEREILRYFEFVVSSADYGIRKPDKVIFEVALRRMGISAADAWFVGDNMTYDIMGSWEAGMFPIVFANPGNPVPEEVGEFHSISCWRELIPLVESVL